MKSGSQDLVTKKGSKADVFDSGRVQMGAVSPSFPPVRVAPGQVKDIGKVHLGAVSPSFPPAR
jgi:hypothetical protein